MEENIKKKIIFVDDDKFLLDMYAMKFAKAGYEVKTADNSESALKMIRDGFAPDIILADIVMPGIDGLEFIGILRKEHLANKSIVIMLSNQGASEDLENAKKQNVNGYIIKATTIPSDVLKEVEKIYKAGHQK